MSSAAYNYNKLAGKNVLIFGGTSGIGYAVAEASLAASAIVTVTSSSQPRINSTVEKLSASFPDSQISGHVCDLSPSTVEDSLEALFEKVGKLDHIVYSAGDVLSITPVAEITRDKVIAAGQLRFFAPLLVAKVGSRFLAPGPEASITFTTGVIHERPFPDWPIVAGYAGAICSAARNLAVDLKPVRVNVVRPGLVDTPLWDAPLTAARKEDMFKAYGGRLPTGKIADVRDVAESYVYLMRDRNATGQIVTTDSGALIV